MKTKAVLKTVTEVVAKSNDVTNSSSTVGLGFSQCGQHLAITTTAGLTLVSRGEGGVWGAPRMAGPGMTLAEGELATGLAWSCEGDLLLVATNKVTNALRLY
jgi:hypothetical protein